MGTNIITIPRWLAKNDDLVVLPRKQYEQVLRMIKGDREMSEKMECELIKLSNEAKKQKKTL